MKQIVLAGLVALATLSPAHAEVDLPRRAECLLLVQGQKLIDGPCTFTALDEDGSFTIATPDKKWFAYVLVDRPRHAEGYWNGAPFAGHAHDPLGGLRRQDACWVNDSASVCAW